MRFLLLTGICVAALGYGCLGGDSDDESGGLPEAIPTFTGAEAVPGGTIAEKDAFIGTWRTSDDVAAVQDYFEQELADGPWRIVETREIDDGVVIRIEETDDPANNGAIVVRREDDGTRIVKSIGRDDDDDSSDGDGDSSADEGDEVVGALPEGYPGDVPLPDDAEIVSGSAPLVNGTQYYLVEFSTPSDPADVIAYFNQALPAEGWQTGAAENDPGAFVLNYSRDGERVLITGGNAEDGTNASISIVIEG